MIGENEVSGSKAHGFAHWLGTKANTSASVCQSNDIRNCFGLRRTATEAEIFQKSEKR